MSKNNLGIKWYSLENILKHDVQYYMIFGERSNGKSYATDKMIIDDFFTHGKQFAFVKRFEDDIKSKYMDTVFSPFENYLLEKYNHRIKFYRGAWYLWEEGESSKINDCKLFGYALSINNVNRTKATNYPKVDTILYEEFMSMDCNYIDDEVNLFVNLVSTITRYRTNVKIFMLANAISKYSPYSSSLGIKLHRMKKGEILLKSFEDENGYVTKFAIERTENVNVFNNLQNKGKIVYTNFGKVKNKMITSGDFEVHNYHLEIDNYVINDNKSTRIQKTFKNKDMLPIVLCFEDYYYRTYLVNNGKNILGFKEIEKPNPKTCKYLINGNEYINGIININSLAYYDDKRINNILEIIVSCMKMKDFVVESFDDGENVVNAFRLSGISLTN